MSEHKTRETKWQKKWEKNKVFQPEITKQKKFLCTFPYPYVNGRPHVGHLFSMMRVEALARYKRAQGYNVLFPQGWHCTGSPLVSAAGRIAEQDPKQISILQDFGVPKNLIKKFEKPEYWIEYFAPKYKEDVQAMGMSIDWRREFITTSLNPQYNEFIKWQFNQLHKKNLIQKGKHPVVWDPKEQEPVSDHARIQGEGETPQEFTLILLQLEKSTQYIATATLRPETIDGLTNIWVNPKVKYLTATVDNKELILTQEALTKLSEQDHKTNITGSILGKDLIGKKVTNPHGGTIPILPATFLTTDKGSGVVMSVPSDAPDDYIALRDLKENKDLIERYNLKLEHINPIPIIDAPGLGTLAAVTIVEEMNIMNQHQRNKLEEAKKIVYKKGFYEGTMITGKHKGKPVQEAKDLIKEELLEQGHAIKFYELTGPVISRSLTNCIVKIVQDQWFITYSDKEWKKKTHKALDNMNLFPEKSRQQFNYVLDWLNDWACTRKEGIGTRLPWDDQWLIESLSDSTLYNAYYTISHFTQHMKPEEVTEELFDYVFLGKGTPKPEWKQLKKEFEYWYPVDLRNSGKDLIQNHLAFMLFNHTAIFPEQYWPKSYGVNGWVTVDGQKMSKSLGNLIPVSKLDIEYGADASRLTILNGGEGMDDPNWDTKLAEATKNRLATFITFSKEQHNKGRTTKHAADDWFASKLHRIIDETTKAMEDMLFRTAIQTGWFELGNTIKEYLKLTNNKPHKKLITEAIEAQIKLLQPFAPHAAEEAWETIGNKTFVSLEPWPVTNKKLINQAAEQTLEIAEQTLADTKSIIEMLALKKPKKIVLYTPAKWKYDFIKTMKKLLETTHNPGEIITELMKTPLKKHGQEVVKLVPRYVKDRSKLPEHPLTKAEEQRALEQATKRFEKETGAKTTVIPEEKAKIPKAKSSMPGKPAILIE